MRFGSVNLIDDTFLVAVATKGLGGLFELAAGIALIFVSPQALHHALTPLAHAGLGVDGTISNGAKLFLVVYFCLRGIIRMGLAIALILEQLWAYPAALLLLAAAIAYQLWLLAAGHFSWALVLLTLFDAAIVGLTWIEYRKLRRGGHIRHRLV